MALGDGYVFADPSITLSVFKIFIHGDSLIQPYSVVGSIP